MVNRVTLVSRSLDIDAGSPSDHGVAEGHPGEAGMPAGRG
jgi:hypothetical protein